MTAPATAPTTPPYLPQLAVALPAPAATADVLPSPRHASHHQIHMRAAHPPLAGAADAPPIRIPGVSGAAAANRIGFAGDADGDEGEEVDGAGPAYPRRRMLVDPVRAGMEGGGSGGRGSARSV